MNTQTPRSIVAVVVYTLALLSLIFFLTASWCGIQGIKLDPIYFNTGISVVTALVAILVNTRSGPGEPVKSETRTETIETHEPVKT